MDGERPAEELRYDARELRRLVAMSFSSSELATFANALGVPVDSSRSTDDTAHALVRTMEARGELPALVARLEAEKPLVVWPAPQPVERKLDPPASVPAAEPVPREEGPAAAPAPAPLVDPFLTGGGEAASAPSRPIALVVGGVVAGVTLGVLAMWLLFFRGDTEAEKAPEGPGSPAAVAAGALRESVAGVVAACGAGSDESSARGAMSAAFERCSRQEILPPRPIAIDPAPAPAPPPPRMNRFPAPAAPAPASRSQACLDACHDQQQACRKSKCGSEPTSASEYPQYQQCLGQCTAPAMRCRLACR